MSWKMNEEGVIELKDGNPIYVDKNGEEKMVHVDTISRLGAEAKNHRLEKEEALNKLRDYEGLDAEAARKALETVSKLDEKALVDSGKVEELKSQLTKQYEGRLKEGDEKYSTLEQRYNDMMINNVFSTSEFVRDDIAVPRDMFEATFRKNFRVENGEVIAVDKDGERLYSKERAGEYASTEEALRMLVEGHSSKDVILRANTGSGTGNKGTGGAHGGGRVMKRADFAKLSPKDQASVSARVRAGELNLVD